MNKNEFLKAINHRGSSVFANEKVFGMNYVPDIFNYRDEQVNKLVAYCRCIGGWRECYRENHYAQVFP